MISNNAAQRNAEAEYDQNQAMPSYVTKQVERAKEEERTRIAREIHDELGGNLIAIKMALAMLTKNLSEQPTLTEQATYIDSLVDRTIEATHRLASNLRPSVLDFGLLAAIEWHVQEFRKQTDIDCTVEADHGALTIPTELAPALYRIVQESLANVSKHANATQVCVALACSRRTVRLRVTDNGRGYIETNYDITKRQALGIRGMIERADSIGGIFTIHGTTGGGTVVSVEVSDIAPGPAQ